MKYENASAAELLSALEWAGRTPDLDLIRAALDRPDELTPGLLKMLAADPLETYDDLEDDPDDDPRIYADIHAGLLLIAYREEQALPIFAEIFRNEEREHLVEWFGTELHHYGPAAVPTLLELAQDKETYEFGRASAPELLAEIGRQHPETRDTIVAGLRALLPPLQADGSLDLPPDAGYDEIWSWAAFALTTLQDRESQPQIVALYEANLIDEFVMGDRDSYLRDLEQGPRGEPRRFDLLRLYNWLHDEEARDRKLRAEREAREAAQRETAARLSTTSHRSASGARTTADYPKVGRNDPCPCGSGLKYKKCHGQPGA